MRKPAFLAAALLFCGLALSGTARAADLIQSYVVLTDVDIAHIITVNSYANGGGSTNSFALQAPGGTITDPFPKSTDNPPLLTYFLGTSTDATAEYMAATSADHLVLALGTSFAAGLLADNDDFATTFSGYNESDLIDALTLIDTSDLDPSDPDYPAQQAAKEAAFNLIGNFSDDVKNMGGFFNPDGGTFDLLSYSTPTLVGGGGALLTPVADAVPESATWAMMLAGLGLAGAAARRRRAAITTSA